METSSKFVKKCSGCGNLDIENGGASELKCCARCELAFYCCRECQARDWPNHKVICKELKQALENVVNSKQMSVSEMMRRGISVSVDLNGQVLNAEQASQTCKLAPALESHNSSAVTTLRLILNKVGNSSSSTNEIHALLSLSSAVSFMSRRLADKLGVTVNDEHKLVASGLGNDHCNGSIPSSCVSVCCPDARDAQSKPITLPIVHIAPVIITDTDALHELVLGRDFVIEMNRLLQCNVVLKSRPDASFLLFNTEAAIKAVIRLPWGEADRGSAVIAAATDSTTGSSIELNQCISPDSACVELLSTLVRTSY